MKKIILLILIVYQGILNAQNLVPNCSFEDTIACPGRVLGRIFDCKEWYSAGSDQSSPDYYKTCGKYPSVPYNANGFQNAATGNSYAGIVPWIKFKQVSIWIYLCRNNFVHTGEFNYIDFFIRKYLLANDAVFLCFELDNYRHND